MKTYLIAIIIFVIVLSLYFLATWNTSTYEDYLYGFWVAEGDDFCEESEIDSMLVFIGNAEGGFTVERTCYIIIMNDLCNQGFTLSYRPGWASAGVGKYSVFATVKFDDEDIWDDCVKITVDMRDGTMKISSGDTIYAKLTKQLDTSNMCRELEDAELV